ncbi:glycosyl hydrolase family 18 protein [Paenibacillus polymyxa]|uniref:glycosyl hydrolase family 18 protein n=1 Tax=Paenibacillus polymyxa TaxID=1406 RepID=UPI0004D496C7|nr:glycosyl hydrolase family 18 protein [Paenibacillus polymyxa]KEO77123.1 glycosyl hydrolase [Paenibacillus polymyxa]MCH6189160.1 glycosyl hydrolase family 18 protein [Paenibacillus polymyxa]MDY8095372.1 glycosyl hydrolase family 18 protein [Paenibacillus polymyxa]WRL57988.1 glycosyl hydrolase family 18 protein [Paenibacillus polymyxa]
MARNHSRRRRKRSRFKGAASLLLFAAIICAITVVWFGNPLHEKPDWQDSVRPIFMQGKLTGYEAQSSGKNMLMPLKLVQSQIDPSVRYEDDSQTVIMATRQSLLYMKVSKAQGELNGKTYALSAAPQVISGEVYIPIEAVREVYGVSIHEDSVTGAVILMKAGEKVRLGNVEKKDGQQDARIALRKEASSLSFILTDVPQRTKVRIWSQQGDWYFVQLDNGYAGYIKSDHIAEGEELVIPSVKDDLSISEKHWEGRPVNLAWEAVYNRKPDPSKFDPMPGVNVVSPTWFSVVDHEGTVESKADPAYVSWAHRKGMEVWGLLSNSFNPELTTEALSTFERRKSIVDQMISLAQQNDLDGINIDFENVHTKDGPNVTQFLRELKPMAREHDLILSIDVTPKSQSEMWSVFLDRKALGTITDYLMVMAYDEHWAASPKAGSVASLPWTEASIKRIIREDEVPSQKVVLGIPLYTRVWSETPKEGKIKVTSKSLGMESAANIIAQFKLNPKFRASEGQNYVEYTEDGVVKKIWLEDQVSLKARVELAKSLKLGGIGVWNRSFADKDAWITLKKISE